MAALIALAAIGLFAVGVLAGVIGLVSVAVRREEANLTLTSEAADNVTRIGRGLNGVHVRVPRRTFAFRSAPQLRAGGPQSSSSVGTQERIPPAQRRCRPAFRTRGEGESS